jgi:hypothetical protein
MAIIFSVLAGGMLILGIVENATNFRWTTAGQPGDQNPFAGNGHWLLNDGKVVLILSGLLIVASLAMWYMALRKGRSDQL